MVDLRSTDVCFNAKCVKDVTSTSDENLHYINEIMFEYVYK